MPALPTCPVLLPPGAVAVNAVLWPARALPRDSAGRTESTSHRWCCLVQCVACCERPRSAPGRCGPLIVLGGVALTKGRPLAPLGQAPVTADALGRPGRQPLDKLGVQATQPGLGALSTWLWPAGCSPAVSSPGQWQLSNGLNLARNTARKHCWQSVGSTAYAV